MHRYSDYNFLLNDGSRVESAALAALVSPAAFHRIVAHDVPRLQACFAQYGGEGNATAVRVCADDRDAFGRNGRGRIGAGLYAAFLSRWLRQFGRSQLLVLRLEELAADPRAYLARVLDFIGVPQPPLNSTWDSMLAPDRSNENAFALQRMWPSTRVRLARLYAPHNARLAALLGDESFLEWNLGVTPGAAQTGNARESAAAAGAPRFGALCRAAATGKVAELGDLLTRDGGEALRGGRGAGQRSLLHCACSASCCNAEAVALLLDRGVDPSARDAMGNTALHLTALKKGALDVAARLLLARGADPRATSRWGQTPADLRRIYGNDGNNAKVVTSGGAASSPQIEVEVRRAGDRALSGAELAARLVAGTPLLLRSFVRRHAVTGIPASAAELRTRCGGVRVPVSSIPYCDRFGGGCNDTSLRLRDFVHALRRRREPGGGAAPWYVFMQLTEGDCFGVDLARAVWAQPLTHALGLLSNASLGGSAPVTAVQLALGPAGSGAPPHTHVTSWSLLTRGAKRWYLLPPSVGDRRAVFTPPVPHVASWLARDLPAIARRSPAVLQTVVQRPGDVLMVPQGWWHATINLEESISIAVEGAGHLHHVPLSSG